MESRYPDFPHDSNGEDNSQESSRESVNCDALKQLNNKEQEGKKGLTSSTKWIIAAIVSITFLIFSSPVFVGLFDNIFRIFGIGLLGKDGSVNFLGHIFSGFSFFIFIRLFLH